MSDKNSRAEPEEVSALRASVPNAAPCAAPSLSPFGGAISIDWNDGGMGFGKRVLTLVPCAVCGAELDNPFGTPNQPSGAVEFVSHGHYGTTVFDPMDGSPLALNICDGCLLRLRAQQRIGIYHSGKFKKWTKR